MTDQFSMKSAAQLVRGGRMTKFKGVVASYAPCMALILGLTAVIAGEARADDLTWDSDPGTPTLQSGDGVWTEGGGPQNWQSQASPDFNSGANNNANTTFDDGDTVTFGNLSGGSANIDLSDDVAPSAMTFASGGYRIYQSTPGNHIDVSGAMGINVQAGNVEFAVPMSNKGTVSIFGAGTLTLSGENADSGTPAAGMYIVGSGSLVITGSTAAEDVVTNDNGTLRIDGGGTVKGNVFNTLGTFTNANGDVEGVTTISGGDVVAAGGSFSGGVQLNDGTLSIDADTDAGGISNSTGILDVEDNMTLNSTVTMTGNGRITNHGTIDQLVQMSDGEFGNGDAAGLTPGIVDADVSLTGANAEFNNYAGSSVTGTVTVQDGALNAQGGSFANITMNGGRMAVSADTTAGVIRGNAGDIDISANRKLTATLTVDGSTVNNDGTVSGPVSMFSGRFNNGDASGSPAGTVEGDVEIGGGTFYNYTGSDVTGTITLDDGDGDPATGGTLNAQGGTFGDVVVDDGDFNVNASTQADNVTNSGGRVLIETAGATLQTNFAQSGGTTRVGSGGRLNDTDGTVTVTGGQLENDVGGTIVDDIAVSRGTLLAAGGTFDGDVAVSGTGTFDLLNSASVGTTTISGGDIRIRSGAALTTDLVQSGGTTTVNLGGTLDDTDGTVAVSGGRLVNRGTVADDVVLSNTGTLVADGGTFSGDVTVTENATFDLDQSATVGTTTVTGGVVDIANGVTLQTDLVQSGGTTTVNTGGVLEDTDGTVALSGGQLVNQGRVADDVVVTDTGSLVADGGSFDGSVTLNGATATMEVNASTTITPTLNVTNGMVNINGTAVLTTDLALGAGRVNVGANAALSDANGIMLNSGTLENAGTVNGLVTVATGGTLTMAGGTFTNGVQATGGDILISADTSVDLTNNGSAIVIASGRTLTDDVLNASGTLNSAGTISGTLLVAGGTVTQNAADPGDPTGGVTGAVTVNNGGTLIANSGTFGAGITAGGLGNVEVRGAVTGNIGTSGGSVTITGTGVLDGDLSNSTGMAAIQTNGQLDGDLVVSGGNVTTDGTITGAGTGAGAVRVSGGDLTTFGNSTIQGVTTVTGGTLFANGGTFGGAGIDASGGTININSQVTGGVSIDGTADLAIAGTSRLSGDVTIEATSTIEATNDGVVNGAVRVEGGAFQNNGTITGSGASNAVTMSGGAFSNNTGGMIDSSVLVQGGTFFANGGSVVGRTQVTDTGALTVSADSSGDVVNGTAGGGLPSGGIVTINAGQTLTGDLANHSGGTTVSGTLDGALELNGGTATTNSNSRVTGVATVSGGTLTANGGTFDNGILATGGNTNVEGEITITSGALTSGDGAVAINTNGVVNGNVVTQNDNGGTATASVQNDGIIRGTATVGAGEVVNRGTLTGAGVVNAGELTNSGQMQTGFTVNGGTLTLAGPGTITGAGRVNTGGSFVASGGRFDDVTNDDGSVLVSGTVAGNILNQRGQTRIAQSGALTGDVTNSANGTFVLGDTGAGTGTLSGQLTNTGGIADLHGTITGGTTNSGATALMRVTAGDEAHFGAAPGTGLTNTGGAVFSLMGTASGRIINDQTGRIAMTGGTLATGSLLETAGRVDVVGASTATGTILNSGTFVVGDGAGGADGLGVTGTLTNQSGGQLRIESDGIIGATTFTNQSGGAVALYGAISSAMTNEGTFSYLGDGTGADATRFGGMFSNAATGIVRLESGTLMFANGLSNLGVMNLSATAAAAGDVVSVTGDYTGGGDMLIDVDFAAATGDRLEVSGDVTGGTTRVFLNDVSTGTASHNGIVVASVSGTAADDAFALANPLDIGAYSYGIARQGSTFVLGPSGGFVPGVVGIEALAHSLLLQNDLPGLAQRSGLGQGGVRDSFGQMRSTWFVTERSETRFAPLSSGTSYRGTMDATRMRGGVNLGVAEGSAGQLTLGVNLSYGTSSTAVDAAAGPASISTTAVSAGVSATWFGDTGVYVDGQAQVTFFDSTISSGGTTSATKGTGLAAGVEVGQRFTLADTGWTLTPKGRAAYSSVRYDDFTSGGGLATSLETAESLTLGLGLSAEWQNPTGEGLGFYGSFMIDHDFAGDISATVAGAPLRTQTTDWMAEVVLGVTHSANNGLVSLFGEVSYAAGLKAPSNTNSLKLAVGGRVAF